MKPARYPSFEALKPRKIFTQKLEKICASLDAGASKVIEHRFFSGRRLVKIQIARLWVTGAYARGAALCGDLDVLASIKGVELTGPDLARHFWGKSADVRVHVGTPEHNSAGVVFSEARLVWSHDMDWRAAMAGIAIGPKAGPGLDPARAIVLRLEQIGCTPDIVEEFLDACEIGHYQHRFVPLEAIDTGEFTHEDVKKGFIGISRSGLGQQKLMPHALVLLKQLGAEQSLKFVEGRLWLTQDGTTLFYLGDGACEWECWLDASRTASQVVRVVVMPSLNARGPNGAWVIEYGPFHPFRKE